MNIVHIIGNGFDLNLGLKTDYKSFYNYYLQAAAKSPGVEALKKGMSDVIINWSDLEIALGEYTKHINSTEEFDEIFEDILNELSDYLGKEENTLAITKVPSYKFYEDLWNPQQYLPTSDRNTLVSFKGNRTTSGNDVNIISLNYTQTIERLLNNLKSRARILNLYADRAVYLNAVEHLHGFLDNRMILGVNDVSQISNSSFHTNEDVLNVLVKPFCNKVSKETTDDKCIKLVNDADLICIFGCSLGDSDKYWWELIGNWLKGDKKLIIFKKSGNTNPRMAYINNRVERIIKDTFLSQTKLNEAEKKMAIDKIYVAANTNMFSELLIK